ncbi:MAG: hypothetical protein ACXW37_07010 [Nitrospira sp.]
MSSDAAMSIRLPPECETALLERFLKAEAMALWTVRSARLQDVPPNVYTFLRKHEEDEQQHLAHFETMIGRQPRERERLPAVPRQWPALAVQIYGYESLGLEFARLLLPLRPDLSSILEDEVVHVGFFEDEAPYPERESGVRRTGTNLCSCVVAETTPNRPSVFGGAGTRAISTDTGDSDSHGSQATIYRKWTSEGRDGPMKGIKRRESSLA